MSIIKILPDNVINKIAAGEVVERPASVVKELVENSLDAQSTAITITVKHGGKELVRVADNGEGMSPDDAQQALKRHATSKISTIEDVFQVQSFGFRGEALPSIAAVSRLTLLTREKEADVGTELNVTGGVVQSIRQAGAAVGTTVEARDLFFNTPARQKFLRSERAEFLATADIVTTFALGNPTVSFRLLHDTRKVMDCPSCTDLRERIAQLHDEDIVAALVPVDERSEEVSISGFVTNPTVSRVNRAGQYFFINRRPVKSPSLNFALQQGYADMLPPNRHGLAFLFFDIVLPRVDVNVHPNKTEVRVANEREVQKLLIEALRNALHSQWRSPVVRMPGLSEAWATKAYELKTTRADRDSYAAPEESAPPALFREPAPEAYAAKGDIREENGGASSEAREHQQKPARAFFEARESGKPSILGQYLATYLLAEYNGKLLIIDQHAAHERVVYEEILSLLENERVPSQRRLIPAVISLDYREQEVLEEYLPMLERIGFGINDLGRNTYSIDAAPALLDAEDPKQLILDIVHQLIEGYAPRAFDDKKKAMAAAIACKSKSVKGASRLQPEAMQHLVERLLQTNQPFSCPHGRPTCITLTREELEKQFGRT